MRIYAMVAAGLVAALIGAMGYFMVSGSGAGDDFAACRGGQVVGEADIGGSFELVDHTGRTVTDADILTEPALIYFGFSFCPDVCPLDNARNARAVDALRERGHDIRPVFISVDPERDTPEMLATFVGMFHDDMIGLTGDAEQVRAAAQAYRVYYQREETDDDYYLVDHSTHSYLVLPGHGFVEFFARDESVDDIAATAACYLENA